MQHAGTLKLSLELDRGVEPISGRLVGADGSTLEFVGWLELTQALEHARRETGVSGVRADDT